MLVSAAKALVTSNYIRLGGTGMTWNTPHSRDVVYPDIEEVFRSAGIKVSTDRALSYIPFFAAVRNISEDIAQLPFKVYREMEDGGKEEARSHPVARLFARKVNPFMTAFTFRETLQGHVLTWGNGYAEIEFATDGEVLALWPLRPDRMSVVVENNQVIYRYRLNDGQHTDLSKRKVLHIHGLGSNGLVGYSVIEKARHMLGMALATEKYGEDLFERGGMPPAVLTHPKVLSDPARKNLRESWSEMHEGLDNMQRIAILEEGLDLKTLGLPPRDVEFMATYNLSRSLTATLLRMPPDMLQDVSRSTSWGTGIEQQKIGYLQFTLGSHTERWDQECTASLLDEEPLFLEHAVDGFLRGDSASRWNGYTQGLDRGVFTIDDVRKKENLNPLPNGLGKRHFVPMNMAPLDQVGEMSMADRLQALAALTSAGIAPAPAAQVVETPTQAADILDGTAPVEPALAGGNGLG